MDHGSLVPTIDVNAIVFEHFLVDHLLDNLARPHDPGLLLEPRREPKRGPVPKLPLRSLLHLVARFVEEIPRNVLPDLQRLQNLPLQVDVVDRELDLPFEGFRHLLPGSRHCLAVAAPVRIEVDDNRALLIVDLLVERGLIKQSDILVL